MKLYDYYRALSLDDREDYARRVGTSPAYMRIHLVPATRPPSRMPSYRMILRLAEASKGAVSCDEVLHHFSSCPDRDVA